jgi:hypothetical protein
VCITTVLRFIAVHRRRLAAVFLLPLVLASCGGPRRLPVQPVRGQVLFRGRPAAHALLILYPEDAPEPVKGLRPSGRSGPDGCFALTTYEQGDGVPPGRYRTTVQWPSEDPRDPSNPHDPEAAVPRGPDLLQGRYSDPGRTPLAITVAEGTSQLEPLLLQ